MDHNHNSGEECAVCKYGAEAVARMEQKNLDEIGWYAHIIREGSMINYHTHGLREHRNIPDFQIVLKVRPETAHGLISELIQICDAGLRPMAGMTVNIDSWKSSKIPGWTCLKVRLEKAIEDNREVLRVILPDTKGDMTRNADFPFKLQYEGIDSVGLN